MSEQRVINDNSGQAVTAAEQQIVPTALAGRRAGDNAAASAITQGAVAAAIQPNSGGSQCGCKIQPAGPSLVYVLGEIGYDFGTQARQDYFVQKGLKNPSDPEQLLIYLEANPTDASELIWTLTQETIPIYALRPLGAYASQTYTLIEQFLDQQLNEGVEMVSVPGYAGGQAILSNGQAVPVIDPASGGMYSWSTNSLVESVLGQPPSKEPELVVYNKRSKEITNFLNRVYYELQNLGVAPQDRAMNYAATNLYQVNEIFQQAAKDGLQLDTIQVKRSSICRPESDCWDVLLTFFNPKKRLEEAKIVFSLTVDVSGVFPVTIGSVESWYAY